MDAFDVVFGEAISTLIPTNAAPRRKRKAAAGKSPMPNDTVLPPSRIQSKKDAFDLVFGEAIENAIPDRRSPRRGKAAATPTPMPIIGPPPPSAISARQNMDDAQLPAARGEGETARAPIPKTIASPPQTIARQDSPDTHDKCARKGSRGGQAPHGTHHVACASAAPNSDIARQAILDAHKRNARNDVEGSHVAADAHIDRAPLDSTVMQIVQLWRTRQRWHRAEKALILQAKAACRFFCGGDKSTANALFEEVAAGHPCDPALIVILQPFLAAISAFEGERKLHEKNLEKLAKTLPIWPFAQSVKGLGALGLASILGEVGHLDRYQDKDGNWHPRNVNKLWKYLGIGTVNGERQRKCADLALAALHVYSPRRRSVLWNIGNGLIGCMGHGPRPRLGEDITGRNDWTEYQKLFVTMCRFYAEKPDKNGELGWRKPVEKEDVGEKESYSAHVAARAKRFVEKRFLVDLFVEWKRIGAAGRTSMPKMCTPRRKRQGLTRSAMPTTRADSAAHQS